jgi:hypothetical protein
MEIERSLQISLDDKIRVSVWAPFTACSGIHPDPFPMNPFKEINGGNPMCAELVQKLSASLFTPTPALNMMSDSIRGYEYCSRDKYSPEDELLEEDGQPMDVPNDAIYIVFDHQVSSNDEEPDVMHLWIDEKLKVTGRKNHKSDRDRANEAVKMYQHV